MAAIRRTPYSFLYLQDVPDAGGAGRIVAMSVLDGKQHIVSPEELKVLARLSTERWVPEGDGDQPLVTGLIAKGLVLSDGDDPAQSALRHRDEALSENQWNLYAALYHYMTQWEGIEAAPEDDEQLRGHALEVAQMWVDRFGPPPDPYAEVEVHREVKLAGAERSGGLYDALLARRTTRSFDPEGSVSRAQLDTILRYVFGCHGQATTVADAVCIKRTSPSGGGLHPVEAYPIISRVDGVASGIYHYSVRDHSLGLIRELPEGGVGLATSLMCGQRFFGTAAVSFVLTARFARNHWKYRRHQRAYAGMLMDAAHLSQTLYLVATELGLGAYITIAINGRDIERELGLDGVSEGALAMAGCGPRAGDDSPLELQFTAGP